MSFTIPEGAIVPQDHLAPVDTSPVDGGDDELLAGMPELKSPGRLRIGESNRIMKLVVRVRSLIPDEAEDGDDDGAPTKEFEIDDLADEDLDKLLDMLDGVDKFAESIAVDPAAYVSWSEGKSMQHMMALLNRYSSAVGESGGSAS